jgi:hypothetical protein
MNTGTLKGFPDQPVYGEVLTVTKNGRVELGNSSGSSTSGGIGSIASFIKWGNE